MKFQFLGGFQDPKEWVQKYVFKRISDGKIIEISHIHTKSDRDIYCIPAHYGCRLGCIFCHITTNNMQMDMIPIQAEEMKEILSRVPRNKSKMHLSIMGVGDPHLNLSYVQDLQSMADKVSVATIFPGDKINKFPKGVKVHYSLHHPDDQVRNQLIPANKVPIIDALEYLQTIESEIHYTLIDGRNDSNECLNKVTELLNRYQVPIKFLEFNETGDSKKSPHLEKWLTTLRGQTNVSVEHYIPPGRNIGSSCGEFSVHFYKEDDLASFKQYVDKYSLF